MYHTRGVPLNICFYRFLYDSTEGKCSFLVNMLTLVGNGNTLKSKVTVSVNIHILYTVTGPSWTNKKRNTISWSAWSTRPLQEVQTCTNSHHKRSDWWWPIGHERSIVHPRCNKPQLTLAAHCKTYMDTVCCPFVPSSPWLQVLWVTTATHSRHWGDIDTTPGQPLHSSPHTAAPSNQRTL